MTIDRSTHRLPADQYFTDQHPKDLIVLHFTAGLTAASAVNWWKQDQERVATAYVLDTDGTVYECFDPRGWAYHLGVEARFNPGHALHKRSIGIEIVNPGPLKLNPDDPRILCWWPNGALDKRPYTRQYCLAIEEQKFVVENWRGFQYWAAYAGDQLSALRELVPALCAEHGIPAQIPAQSEWRTYDPARACAYRGVIGHQMVRRDKTDPGPALSPKVFDQILKEVPL